MTETGTLIELKPESGDFLSCSEAAVRYADGQVLVAAHTALGLAPSSGEKWAVTEPAPAPTTPPGPHLFPSTASVPNRTPSEGNPTAVPHPTAL